MSTPVYSFKQDLFVGPLDEGGPPSMYKRNNSHKQVWRSFWEYIVDIMSKSEDSRLSQLGANTKFHPETNQIVIQAVEDEEDDEDSPGNTVIFTLDKNTGEIHIQYSPSEDNAWVQFAEGDVVQDEEGDVQDEEGKIANIKKWLEVKAIQSTTPQGGSRKTAKRKTAKRKTAKRKTAKRKTTKRKTFRR